MQAKRTYAAAKSRVNADALESAALKRRPKRVQAAKESAFAPLKCS
jgi:hypothetical protein